MTTVQAEAHPEWCAFAFSATALLFPLRPCFCRYGVTFSATATCRYGIGLSSTAQEALNRNTVASPHTDQPADTPADHPPPG
jgi:hypothetical protein